MGVAVTKRGEPGVSPISSVVNVISRVPESLSPGTLLVKVFLKGTNRPGGFLDITFFTFPLDKAITLWYNTFCV